MLLGATDSRGRNTEAAATTWVVVMRGKHQPGLYKLQQPTAETLYVMLNLILYTNNQLQM